jgi:hypothetical protein
MGNQSFQAGDKVRIIRKCGAKFSEDNTEEFYNEGEIFSVLDLRNGHKFKENGSIEKTKGLVLKENHRLLVPFEAVEKVTD